MIQHTLVGDGELERLPVVANCTMNRGRGLVSYERELGVPFRKLLHDQPTLTLARILRNSQLLIATTVVCDRILVEVACEKARDGGSI